MVHIILSIYVCVANITVTCLDSHIKALRFAAARKSFHLLSTLTPSPSRSLPLTPTLSLSPSHPLTPPSFPLTPSPPHPSLSPSLPLTLSPLPLSLSPSHPLTPSPPHPLTPSLSPVVSVPATERSGLLPRPQSPPPRSEASEPTHQPNWRLETCRLWWGAGFETAIESFPLRHI